MAASNGFLGPSVASEAPHYESFNIPLRKKDRDDASTNEDEWEYEYSQTETEVCISETKLFIAAEPSLQDYYLTLDLTTPSLSSHRPSVPRGLRGGYVARWITPGIGRKKDLGAKITLPKSTQTGNTRGAPTETPAPDADEENEDAEGEADDDDDIAVADAVEEEDHVAGTTETDADAKLEDIQILDLHSENPMVTYRGHVFSCSWAENIGTELLFTKKDAAKPLPTLRSLPDDIDLLAASSARLISRPVQLKPKPASQQTSSKKTQIQNQAPVTDSQQNEFSPDMVPVIPFDANSSAARKSQASFLTALSALKLRKGETDQVTIIAQKRLMNHDWRVIVEERRKARREELIGIMRRGVQPAADEARRELKDFEQQDNALAKQILQGRKRKHSSGGDFRNRGNPSGTMTNTNGKATSTGARGSDSDDTDTEIDSEDYEDGRLHNEGQGAIPRRQRDPRPAKRERLAIREIKGTTTTTATGSAALMPSALVALRTSAPDAYVPQRALSMPTPRRWADLDDAGDDIFDDDDLDAENAIDEN